MALDQSSGGGQETEAAATGAGGGARKAAIIAAALIGVIALAYVIAVLTTWGRIPGSTYVAGVDIGGMSKQDAAAALERELAEISAAPINVTALGQESSLAPSDVGLAADYAETAELASGPIFDPWRLLRHITGRTVEVDPVVSYDAEAMAAVLESLSLAVDDPPEEPSITIAADTPPVVVKGVKGSGVDRERAAEVLAEAYLRTTGPLELPVKTLDPAVSDEEAQRVLEEFALPAVSAPVTVTFEGGTEELAVAEIAGVLSFAPAGSTLEPQLNVAALRAALPGLAAVERPGKNATWDVSSGVPVVVPSSPGRGFRDEELVAAVLEALPEQGAERTAAVTIAEVDPELTTEQAQALNIKEKLSSFTQRFEYAEYRLINIGQAAKYMNGTVLKPGEIYSMNETIKERTKANGYVSGTFISNGRFQEGLGGGVSTATTATWTAAFYAGLEAIEVHPHSLYISRYQPGLEATVAWGQLDLRFRNNTGNGVLITTESGGTFITVTMWGTKVYDKIEAVSSERYNVRPYPTVNDTSAGCKPQGGVNGFTIDVTRVFYKGGQVVDREKFTTRYDPTTRVICAPAPPPPAPAPSPTPEPPPEG